MEGGIIISEYFNDKYSTVDEFRANAEKVILIKICNRSKNSTTIDELCGKIHCSHYVKGDNE